jgi:hypothetical protein
MENRLMKMVVVVAAVVLGVIAVVATVFVAGYFHRVPAPAGFDMPRHGLWGGGPAALFTGTIVEEQGCLVTDSDDDPSTVVWPARYYLRVNDGHLEVHGDGRVYVVGQPVALGGGQYHRDELNGVAPEAATTRCPEPFWLTTGWGE